MNLISKKNLVLMTLFLGACAGTVKESLTPEDIVRDKAQARFEAFLDKKREGLVKALSFTTPSFRSVNTEKEYASRYGGRGQWESADIEKVSCEESVCEVSIKLVFRSHRIPMPVTTFLQEKWIEIDGEWWVYHK